MFKRPGGKILLNVSSVAPFRGRGWGPQKTGKELITQKEKRHASTPHRHRRPIGPLPFFSFNHNDRRVPADTRERTGRWRVGANRCRCCGVAAQLNPAAHCVPSPPAVAFSLNTMPPHTQVLPAGPCTWLHTRLNRYFVTSYVGKGRDGERYVLFR